MTPTRYIVARIAQAFGYVRRPHRMASAASETHLLREAESYLGQVIWEKVEKIEALSVEYWNLRKLIKERDEVRAKLAACQERLNQAHEERVNLINSMPMVNQELLDERTALLTSLEDLARKRDQIVAEARDIRRIFVGLKMKLEVLSKEPPKEGDHAEEIQQVKARLKELKVIFAELKEKRIQIGKEIEEGDNQVDLVDEKMREERKNRRIDASAAFQVIGEGNKEMSILRAESGLMDTRMRQLYAEIGRYVSRHANQDPACAKASASHHSLVDVMRAMRRSISLNHKLAGNS